MSEEAAVLKAIHEVTHELDPTAIRGMVVWHRDREMRLYWPDGDGWSAFCEVEIEFKGERIASGEGDTPTAALNACADTADDMEDEGRDQGDPRPPMHEIMHSASEMGGYDQDNEIEQVARLDLSRPPQGYYVEEDGRWGVPYSAVHGLEQDRLTALAAAQAGVRHLGARADLVRRPVRAGRDLARRLHRRTAGGAPWLSC
jgi:hypothetical protein